MRNWKSFLFLMLLASFITACTANKKDFVPAEPSAEKGSVVYIYRPAKMANVMLTPDLNIAGVDKIEIANGSYKKLYLSPGIYAVRLQAIEGVTESVDHELKIIKGRVHYLRVDASMKVDTGQQSYQPYKRAFALKNVPARQARQEIASCKNLDSVKKRRSGSSAGGENDNDEGASFSVDKTLNPFSR